MNRTYCVEIFTSNQHTIVFVKADTRPKAIKLAKDEVRGKSVSPTLARPCPDQTADDMIIAAKHKIIDARNMAPVVATREMRSSLGALVGR